MSEKWNERKLNTVRDANMYFTIFSMYESKSSSFNVNFSLSAYVVVFVHLLLKTKNESVKTQGGILKIDTFKYFLII